MGFKRKFCKIYIWGRYYLLFLATLLFLFFIFLLKTRLNLEEAEWSVFTDQSLLRQIQEHHLTSPVDRSVPYNLSVSTNSYKQHDLYHEQLMQIIMQRQKTPGFFVEAGALDGEFLSHTLDLERLHGWTGVLIEASPSLVPQLKSKNRKSWIADVCLTDKVYEKIGFLSKQNQDENWKRGSGKLVSKFDLSETRDEFISEGKVDCYSLYSLLKAVNTTEVVDLLVLDIEGGEFRILQAYPFHLVPIKIIAMEYMLVPESTRILVKFMEEKGYWLEYRSESDMIFVLN